MKGLTQRAADLKVGHKLLLGFAAVILMTLVVAAGGWLTAKSIQDHAHNAMVMASTQDTIRNLRLAEKDYLLAATQDNTQLLLQTHQALLQDIDELHAIGVDTTRLAQEHADYLSRFHHLSQAREQAELAESAMAIRADEALLQFEMVSQDQFNLIRDLFYEGQTDPGTRIEQAEGAARLTQQLMQLRLAARQYLRTHAQSDADAWLSQFAAMQTTASQVRPLLEPLQQAALDEALKSLANYQEGFTDIGKSLAEQASARQALTSLTEDMLERGSTLRAEQTQKIAEQNQTAMLILGLTTLIALVIALIASTLIRAMIVGPLKKGVELAEQVAKGDLTGSHQRYSQDEVGQLLSTLQLMRDNLRQLIAEIGASASLIASSAEELSAVSEQTRSGVIEQSHESSQTASAMAQMVASVQQVANDAENASNAAENAEQQTHEGEALVKKVVQQIEALAKGVAHTGQSVGQLQVESAQIGSVLDVIKSVAEQTNLLALNAAIEAARAGEQGRGFAVVADAVRGLAQRTQESTREIEALIGNLQKSVEHSVNQTRQSERMSLDAVEIVEAAGSSLVKISQAATLIQQMNQQIASAAEEQSAVAQEINRSVETVRSISEQSATATEQTAQSSIELARLGHRLQEQINHFRT